MNDATAIQNAIYHGLRSCTLFRDVNVVMGIDELISAEVKKDAAWLTPSPGGKTGVAMIVQIPELQFPKPNSLQRLRTFSVLIVESREMNFTPGIGTFRMADDWADQLVDFLWNYRLARTSGLILENQTVTPDPRIQPGSGLVGMRVTAYLRQERQQPPRAATPVISVDQNNFVALTVTDGSTVYYTTDGFSSPSPDTDGSLATEMIAVKYQQPFQAPTGTVVMAQAYADGKLPSQLADACVP